MVKRSFGALLVVGMVTSLASAGSAPYELLYNGHTGQADDPVMMMPGVAQPLTISLRNNTPATQLRIGGASFDFSSPGNIGFDYDGADNVSDPFSRPTLADDGWQWGGPVGDPFDANGNAAPAYSQFGGGIRRTGNEEDGFFYPQPYLFSNSPPQTAFGEGSDALTVRANAGATVELGTLMITPNLAPGPGNFVLASNGAIFHGVTQGFRDITQPRDGFPNEPFGLDNAASVHLVVPEPATLALMAVGGLLGLRRRRQA
ncbi:MAG: PEP-CTERM sorting domain-containing protein [Phycisphaerales bacterium]|nr:PEP-CTERM sorting domain-containing protein [Phycisphaerales bacterium]